MKKVGIYGGSFSPPHIGHFKSALAFYDYCALDLLYILPAGVPPHKELKGNISSADRLAMTKCAFAPEKCGKRNIVVSSYEIDQEGKSYSYLTLEAFTKPDQQLFMLVGSDMLLSLEHWAHPEIILSLATVVLNRREDGEDMVVFEEKKKDLQARFGGEILLAEFEPYAVSSSEIRAELASGDLPKALDPDVYRYISAHRLYGNLDALKSEIATRLSKKRTAHVFSVEREVVRMGKMYGFEGEALIELRKAALLHDITHEASAEEQCALANAYGISLSEEDLAAPAILHQLTGAAVAKAEFSLSDVGCAAIACHTTGKPKMTTAEKILCLADYIEETREYPACKQLREAFYSHFTAENKERLLDETMMRYLENTVEHLCARKAVVHPLALECLEFLKNTLVNYTIL